MPYVAMCTYYILEHRSAPRSAAPPYISGSRIPVMAMGVVVTRAKKRRMEEEERISSLPDGVLGDIVSLLPTKDGARTQVLSSRWRHIWRSAPLNIDLRHDYHQRRLYVDEIPRVLCAHPGPGRRFSVPEGYGFLYPYNAAALDGWLRSPALEKLQELDLNSNRRLEYRSTTTPVRLLPSSVDRFSSTLRIARFSGFDFPDGTDAKMLHLPLLEQLTLLNVGISEISLNALITSCCLLQSLLLLDNHGFPRMQIESSSLKSIGVRVCPSRSKDIKLEQLLVVDAPCLQRLLCFQGRSIYISVISAPRLNILGEFFDNSPKLEFTTTVTQGLAAVSMTNVVHSVKVLALSNVILSLDAVIDLLKCFPHLEKLYIKATTIIWVENEWYHKYRKLIGTLDIRLRKIVLANYQGNKSHIDFAKFFLSNARMLESMRLESVDRNISKDWIARQRRLLNAKKRASRGAQFSFVVSPKIFIDSPEVMHAEQVHDLSTTDPFQRLHQ